MRRKKKMRPGRKGPYGGTGLAEAVRAKSGIGAAPEGAVSDKSRLAQPIGGETSAGLLLVGGCTAKPAKYLAEKARAPSSRGVVQ